MANSLSRLAGLHPQFRRGVDILLSIARENGVPVTITSGKRSVAEQRAICAELQRREQREGKRYPCATPGLSAHQYGLAVDLVAGKSLTSEEHRWLREVGKLLGFNFVADDPPHFEHPAWPALRRQISATATNRKS